MLLNIGKAITSPGFIGAYLKGIIKGFFVEGLWGTITFLWEIVKLPFTIAVFIAKLAAYLSSPEWIKKVVAITKAIQETGNWLKENGAAMIQDLQKEAGGGGGIQLGAIFNALVSSAGGWVQKGGEKMADQMMAFFSQSPDKLGPVMGNTVGTVVGAVLFEVVLSVVTFGGGSAVTATKTALRPIFTLLAKVGSGAMKAITTLAAKLRKWISGAAKSLVAFLVKISRKIGSKVDGLLAQVRKWVDELEGGAKKTRKLFSDSKLGTWNGKKILSETPTHGGHKLKVLEDGSCLICSRCDRIKNRFAHELSQNPNIEKRIQTVENQLNKLYSTDYRKLSQADKTQIDTLIKEQGQIHEQLLDLKANRIEQLLKNQKTSNPFSLETIKKEILDGKEFNHLTGKFEKTLAPGELFYGPNKLDKLKKHSQHIRETARRMGIEIPKSPSNPNTIAEMETFLQKVVDLGDKKQGPYMTFPSVEWSRLGDAIVIRKPNGEFISIFDHSKGGVAKQWDNLP